MFSAIILTTAQATTMSSACGEIYVACWEVEMSKPMSSGGAVTFLILSTSFFTSSTCGWAVSVTPVMEM
jgi:hypothetical protein